MSKGSLYCILKAELCLCVPAIFTIISGLWYHVFVSLLTWFPISSLLIDNKYLIKQNYISCIHHFNLCAVTKLGIGNKKTVLSIAGGDNHINRTV